MKRGTLIRRHNLDKKSAADPWYFSILVKNPEGKYETLLCTEEDLVYARQRTRMNPEDEAVPTWIDKLVRILGKQPPLELPETHSEK